MESIKYNPNPPDQDIARYAYEEFQRIRSELDELGNDFIVPSSINLVVGGTPVGAVADVQTLQDGNVYGVPEVTGAPGFDIEFNFSNVRNIKGFVSHISYRGSATHVVTLRLRNYSTAADNQFLYIPSTATAYSYRTVLIPDGNNYIDGSDAQITLYHDSNGNAAHNVFIDYIALIGRRNARY